MSLDKIKKQNFDNLRNTRQSDLHDTINKFLSDLTDDQKGRVAGLCIEYVIQSGGNPDIFDKGEIGDLLEDEEEDGEIDNDVDMYNSDKFW